MAERRHIGRFEGGRWPRENWGPFFVDTNPKVHGTFFVRECSQNYHTCVLFDSTKMGNWMNLMTTAWEGKILKGNFIFQAYIFRCFCCYCQAGIGFLYSLCITSLDGIGYWFSEAKIWVVFGLDGCYRLFRLREFKKHRKDSNLQRHRGFGQRSGNYQVTNCDGVDMERSTCSIVSSK